MVGPLEELKQQERLLMQLLVSRRALSILVLSLEEQRVRSRLDLVAELSVRHQGQRLESPLRLEQDLCSVGLKVLLV